MKFGLRNLLLLIATILTFTTCCKDEKPCMDPSNPDCQNYDPCFGKERPSAKFIMEESNPILANQGLWFADSIFAGYKLRFRSELTDAKYKHKWYVGSEVFTTSTTPDRDFGDVFRPNYITISHVIEYEPDLSCFPDDDGKDSVAQTFRLISSFNEFRTHGTFRGVLNNNNLDSFNIVIVDMNYFNRPATLDSTYSLWFINFHNRGDTITSKRDFSPPLGIDMFRYNLRGVFDAQLEGTFIINTNNEFEMRYRNVNGILEFLGDRNWHTFKGRKIN